MILLALRKLRMFDGALESSEYFLQDPEFWNPDAVLVVPTDFPSI